MLRLKQLFWFPELRASVLDFRADTTRLRAISIIILTDTIGTRTSITIHTPEMHMPTIQRRQRIGTLRIGLITIIIATTLTAPSKSELTFQDSRQDRKSFRVTTKF